MTRLLLSLALVPVLMFTVAWSAQYTVSTVYAGNSFTDPSQWSWLTDSEGSAIYMGPNTPGLFGVTTLSTDFYAATFTSVPDPYDSSKRYSFHLRGTKVINPNTLIMMQLSSMPYMCSTWPAFWLYSENSDSAGWPNGGEIDIIEGVHGGPSNRASLHTPPGCVFTNQATNFDGTWIDRTCRSNHTNDEGCTISATNADTFGYEFNQNGGGWIAFEWTAQSSSNSGTMSMWHIPASANYQWQNDVNTANFPASASKYAEFDLASGNCPASYFANMNMVLNLAVCGGWADQAWESSGCMSLTGSATCEEYISSISGGGSDYASAMQFVINSISIYTPSN